MRLRRRTAKLAPAVVLWNRLVDKLVKDEGRRHFVPNEPENPHINYFRNPISGVKELMELMEQLSNRLDRIKVPTLVIQSSEDPVVHPEGSKEVYENLGSEGQRTWRLQQRRGAGGCGTAHAAGVPAAHHLAPYHTLQRSHRRCLDRPCQASRRKSVE